MRRREFLAAAAGALAANRISGQQTGALLAPTPADGLDELERVRLAFPLAAYNPRAGSGSRTNSSL